MICAELADEGTEQRPRNEREEFAHRGMDHADRAISQKPDAVEAHYYKALCIGRYLEAERLPSFSLVKVIASEGERAAEIDHYFECSGAHRLLGALYSEAPEWGPGGVGDKEKAEKHFNLALKFTPECPENHLSYAKYLISMEHPEEAKVEVEKGRALVDAHQGISEPEKQRLRDRCVEMLKEIDGK